MSHHPRFYAAPNFLKMGIKYLNTSSFIQVLTIKDEKTAAKFHYIKTLSSSVVAQLIAFRVVSIYWQGGSSVPFISECKGPTRIGSTCVAHTSPHSAEPWRHCVTSLRSAHWLVSSLKLAVRCPVSGCWLSCSISCGPLDFCSSRRLRSFRTASVWYGFCGPLVFRCHGKFFWD